MKTRVNLTIEDSVLAYVKSYAASKGVSVSELVEHYLKSIARPSKKKNIIHLVEKLNPPSFPDKDLKEAFYKDQSEKYGF